MAKRKTTLHRAPGAGLAQVLTSPFDMAWLRGPTRLDGQSIVLDLARAEVYHPMRVPHIGEELMRVKTKEDAILFSSRFGLLHESGREARHPDDLATAIAHGVILQDKLYDVLEKAMNLDQAVRTIHSVRRAAAGSEDSLIRLRAQWAKGGTDREALMKASSWATSVLSQGLAHSKPFVYDRSEVGVNPAVQPGQIALGIIHWTLWNLCYFQVATWLSESVRIAICEECNRVFEMQDGRQKFCQPSCANRNRLTRWKAGRESLAKRKKGAKRNATTRKR